MKKIKTTKKSILISVLILAIVAAGVFYFFKTNEKNNSKTQSDSSNQGINYSPPTEEEAAAGDKTKETTPENEGPSKPLVAGPDGLKSVEPVITYAAQYGQNIEVGGYIPRIFEEGGTCTAVFTLNANSFSKSVQAVENARSVDCPTISVGSSEFSQKGSWSVVLNYSSNTSKGSSSPLIVEVK